VISGIIYKADSAYQNFISKRKLKKYLPKNKYLL